MSRKEYKEAESLDQVITQIFMNSPQPPSTIVLVPDVSSDQSRDCEMPSSSSSHIEEKHAANILTQFIVIGAQILFPEIKNPRQLSNQQVKLLKMYTNSVGYTFYLNQRPPDISKCLPWTIRLPPDNQNIICFQKL